MIRDILAWMCLFAGGFLLGSDIARLQITGISAAALLLLVAAVWLFGAFRPEFWFGDISEDHPDALGSLDLAERAHLQETHQ